VDDWVVTHYLLLLVTLTQIVIAAHRTSRPAADAWRFRVLAGLAAAHVGSGVYYLYRVVGLGTYF
jgi:hypothetical protein